MSFSTHLLRAFNSEKCTQGGTDSGSRPLMCIWRLAMKAWLLKDFGLDNLQLAEVATP
jgi:hypothetical protein